MVTALDVDRSKIEYLQLLNKDNNKIDFIFHDLNDLPSLNLTPDLIIMIDVLEHIEGDKKLLQACHNQLNKNRIIILHVPCNDFDPHGRFGLRKFKLKKQAHAEHERDGYSKNELQEMLSESGFRNIRIHYTAGTLSMFAHTIFEFYRGHNYLFYSFLHPIMMSIVYVDLLSNGDNIKHGGGIISSGEKH